MLATGCAAVDDDPRRAAITAALTRGDLALARSRPALIAGRYARMAAAPYDFYRGAMSLWLRDWRDSTAGLSASRFALEHPMPRGVGDPHPENFGTLEAADGTLSLQPNDLDGADRVPYLWDLRRLTVGIALAARLGNADNPAARTEGTRAARDAVEATARAYADTLAALAAGRSLPPRTDSTDGGAILDDLFRRARRDQQRRAELGELTRLTDTRRTLLRGAPDPDEPTQTLTDLPDDFRRDLPALLRAYRATLAAPPPPDFFTVLDAAREYGAGVASWARLRVLVLVRGASDAPDDDVVLEVKELADAITPGQLPPGVSADALPARVLAATRTVWTRPQADPLWGALVWRGVALQVRAERASHKSVRVARMTGALGTAEALRALGAALGAQLAAAHGSDRTIARALAAVLARDPAGFVREQADVTERYAPRVLDDHTRFVAALAAQGPLLGLPLEPEDAPAPGVIALFGGWP